MPERAKVHRAHETRSNAIRKHVSNKRLSPSLRGYDKQWAAFARRYRRTHPLCVACYAAGVVKASACVDHIEPLRDAPHRKYDETNLQSLCWSCHSRKTKTGQ